MRFKSDDDDMMKRKQKNAQLDKTNNEMFSRVAFDSYKEVR